MLTVTDLFAGAGGSSTGAIGVPGVSVRLAANHWQKAVDVHNANHPDADHLCADISQVNPRYVPSTDILWASPECTNHSQAKGRRREGQHPDLFGETLPDEAAERSRATMWDVPRFTEAHGYQAIIVENVVDAVKWPPFQAWLAAMDSYGYDHQLVSLNSMHAQSGGLPAPQSRDRIYIVFWRKGNRRPDLAKMQRPRAWCPSCEEVVESRQLWKPGRTVGKYRQQYIYACPKVKCAGRAVEPAWLPASAAIDWTLSGQLIGDRARPLADKTRRRIAAGIARYWHQPLHVEAAGNTYDAANPRHPAHGDPNGYFRAWPTDEVLRSLHTTSSKALVVQMEGRAGDPRVAGDPLRTQTARHTDALVTPLHVSLMGGGETHVQQSARPVTETLRTLTAEGNNDYLLAPYYGTAESAQPVTDPIGTLTTRDRYALVTRHFSSPGNGAEMTTPVYEALRTLTTTAQQSVLTPGDIEAAEAQVDDCLFRMLEPHEVAAGMAFPGSYIWQGTRRERVKMAGNAVTPPAARDLVAAVAESIQGAA